MLVDFWSPFCVRCRGLRRHVEKLADAYSGTCRFGALDLEKHADVGPLFAISSVPTFLLFRDGALLERLSGAVLPSHLRSTLDAALAA